MEMVGAILNTFFQCDDHMIEAVLCIKDQFQYDKEDLLDWMVR